MKSYFLKVWSVPIVLAILTIIGLLAALIGANHWHFISWALLAIPLIVMMKYILDVQGKKSK